MQDRDVGVPCAEEPEARRFVAMQRFSDTAIPEKTADSHGDTTIAGALTESCEDATVARLSARVEELDLDVAFGLNEMTMALAECDGDVGSDMGIIYVRSSGVGRLRRISLNGLFSFQIFSMDGFNSSCTVAAE